MCAILIVLSLTWFNTFSRWDLTFYDIFLTVNHKPPPDDIVIIEIDDRSLAELGRWPWSRSVLARLVSVANSSGARAIGLDVILSENATNDVDGDAELTRSIKSSGRVVLPVLVELLQSNGQLVELLPHPLFASSAHNMGHVDVELDEDGICRSQFLKAGLGDAFWSSFPLTILATGGGSLPTGLPGTRAPPLGTNIATSWIRDYKVLIPFRGPPGTFKHVSALDVLDGTVDKTLFKNSYVLIGATASGLSDSLPTPASSQDRPMPGVEITANILAGLKDGSMIEETTMLSRLIYAALLVLGPLLLFPSATPQLHLGIAFGGILLTMLYSQLLLLFGNLWFPPTATLFTLAVSFPTWSWWRLNYALDFLSKELVRLDENIPEIKVAATPGIQHCMDFLQRLEPSLRYRILDIRSTQTSYPPELGDQSKYNPNIQIFREFPMYGLKVELGFEDQSPEKENKIELTNAALDLVESSIRPPSRDTIEVLEQRIDAVEVSNQKLLQIVQTANHSLSQMSGTIVLVNAAGQIVFVNRIIPDFLADTDTQINLGSSVYKLSELIPGVNSTAWNQAIRDVLLKREPSLLATNPREGLSLVVRFEHHHSDDQSFWGMVLTIYDISALRESERRREEVLAFLSHDIRAPLVSIISLLELASTPEKLDKREDILSRMREYTDHALHLADQFLELARIEESDEIPMLELDFLDVAQNALDQVWSQAHLKHIKLIREFPDEAFITGDQALLERSIINLLANAIAYSGEDTEISVSVTIEGGELICHITDQGDGIPAAKIPTLFDRFNRGGRPHGGRGSGLGLNLVKTVVEKHNGQIHVTSNVGDGSCFTIRLPATQEPTA